EANYDPKIGKVYFGEGKSLNQEGEFSDRVLAVRKLFDQAQIQYHIEEDMIYSIWYKFMSNMGENLTCALLGVPYIAFHRSEHANLIRNRAMEEVVAVAKAKGIGLSEKDIELQNRFIEKLPAANIPSTLQDLEAGKKTEIEMFAGRMMEFGKEYGIATPYCELFYHAIRVLEEKNEGLFLVE
ncbi:MAG: ketopantoate reductase family protein, partial [Vallitaleaceae bacterium]|nr:ketopantoate reductase family protein [Vallitaleaceae bacterium]